MHRLGTSDGESHVLVPAGENTMSKMTFVSILLIISGLCFVTAFLIADKKTDILGLTLLFAGASMFKRSGVVSKKG